MKQKAKFCGASQLRRLRQERTCRILPHNPPLREISTWSSHTQCVILTSMVPGKDGGIIDHVVVGDITQPADHPVQDRALLLLLVVVGVTG